jgi:hypothetical protein
MVKLLRLKYETLNTKGLGYKKEEMDTEINFETTCAKLTCVVGGGGRCVLIEILHRNESVKYVILNLILFLDLSDRQKCLMESRCHKYFPRRN